MFSTCANVSEGSNLSLSHLPCYYYVRGCGWYEGERANLAVDGAKEWKEGDWEVLVTKLEKGTLGNWWVEGEQDAGRGMREKYTVKVHCKRS